MELKACLQKNFLILEKLDSAEKSSLLITDPQQRLAPVVYKLERSGRKQGGIFEEMHFKFFARHEIRYFIYIGGNDSMDTVDKMSKYSKKTVWTMCLLSGLKGRLTMILSKRITARALDLRQNIWQQPLQSWRDCHVYERRL